MKSLSLRSFKKLPSSGKPKMRIKAKPRPEPEEDLEDDVHIERPIQTGRAFRELSHADLERMYFDAFLEFEVKPVFQSLVIEFHLERYIE